MAFDEEVAPEGVSSSYRKSPVSHDFRSGRGQKRADDLYPPQQRDHGTGKGMIATGRRYLPPITID